MQKSSYHIVGFLYSTMLSSGHYYSKSDQTLRAGLRIVSYATAGHPTKASAVSSPSSYGRTQFHKFRLWKKHKESQEKMAHFKNIMEHAFAKTPSRFQLVDVNRDNDAALSVSSPTSHPPLSVLALSKELKSAMEAMKISAPTRIQVNDQVSSHLVSVCLVNATCLSCTLYSCCFLPVARSNWPFLCFSVIPLFLWQQKQVSCSSCMQ